MKKMKQYRATIKHDKGAFKLLVTAQDSKTAIDMICKAEHCPENAIKMLEVMDWKPIMWQS